MIFATERKRARSPSKHNQRSTVPQPPNPTLNSYPRSSIDNRVTAPIQDNAAAVNAQQAAMPNFFSIMYMVIAARMLAENINPCSKAKRTRDVNIQRLQILESMRGKMDYLAFLNPPLVRHFLLPVLPKPAIPGNNPTTTAGAWCFGVAVKL